jgi:predicted TIM-barrel fold metal-dependent hydrolase
MPTVPETLSRRRLLGGAAGAVAAALGAPGIRSAAPGFAVPGGRGRYIDVHTHLGRTWNTTEVLSAAGLLAWMDDHEVEQAVVLPLVSPESSSYPATSDFVLAETRPHRDRLIPFCCIDPRTNYTGGKPALGDMVRRYVDQGARGFGEHKTGVRIDDPRSLLLYEVCGELGLPVLYHSDSVRNADGPGLPALERILRTFPRTTFIAHAGAWWSSISAEVREPGQFSGYPKGPVVPGGALERILKTCPNIHGDLSAGSGANAIQRDLKFGREFLIRWADRLLFGTDYLSPGQAVPQFALFRDLDLPGDVQAKIFRDNARRVLKLA